LLKDETVDIEEAIPVEELAEAIDDAEDSTLRIFDEGTPSREEPYE